MRLRGMLKPEQLPAFSRFVAKVTKDHPRFLPLALRLAGMGYHCEKLTRQVTALRGFKEFLESELALFDEARRASHSDVDEHQLRREALERANAREVAIPEEFRFAGDGIAEALAAFRLGMRAELPLAEPEAAVPVNLPVAGA